MRHPTDNRVHYSELKSMARSPAHYRYACEHARESTRAMTVGSVSDAIVFGTESRIAVYGGPTRRGKEWEQFQQVHAGKVICIQSEYDDAIGSARAILADPVASGILKQCEFQVCIQWEQLGLPCASGIPGERGGIDALDLKSRTIWDVKATADAEPGALNKHAWRMWWHAQLAWMADGWDAGEMDRLAKTQDRIVFDAGGQFIKHAGLICVEAQPPHVVTVMRCPTDVLDHGRKSVRLWLERLKSCEESNFWPGYAQGESEMSVPDWMEAAS